MECELASAEDYRVRSDSQTQRYRDARGACLFRGAQLATIDAIRPGTSRRFLLWCLFLCFAFNSARASADQKNMAKLVTASRFADPDAAYVALVEARRGLSVEAAADLDARLVLILANHIGDPDVLREAIDLAKTVETQSVQGT